MSDFRDPTAFIPHRPPILCIESILSIEEDRVSTEARVPDGEELLWEPWLVEGMAQTAAVRHGTKDASSGAESAGKGMLVGIRSLQIHRRPRAGETLRYEAKLVSELGSVSLFGGKAFVGDELIAAGELKFFVEG